MNADYLFLNARHRQLWDHVADVMEPCDLAHDAEHVYRVYRWALRLATEAGASADLAGAAALVHDLVQIPKSDPARSESARRSAAASIPILKTVGYDQVGIRTIIDAVATASWSAKLEPRNAEGVALQDADRLDAIGAIGIARTFACAQGMANEDALLYDRRDPTARTGRTLDDRHRAVDHFFVKLLKLADALHLPTARAEGARRHARLLTFLDALEQELSTVRPIPQTSEDTS